MDLSDTRRTAVNPLASLPAPPPTIPPWERVLWYVAELVITGAGYTAYKYAAEIFGFGSGGDTTTANTWRRFSFKWENTVSLESADDVYFTIDIANITNGQLDSTWTTGDYDNVVTALGGIVAGVTPVTASHLTLTQIASYVMGFNAYSNAKPFAPTGPPEYTVQQAHPGQLAQPAGAQICTTVTEMTPLRLHWGRFYSPSLGANSLTGGGRLAQAFVSSIATAVHDAYAQLMAGQYFPVVPTTQSNKQPLRALQAVTGVRVDDVPDVQRSRRPKYANFKVTQPLPAKQTLPAPDNSSRSE